jgi:hypothetical protein
VFEVVIVAGVCPYLRDELVLVLGGDYCLAAGAGKARVMVSP